MATIKLLLLLLLFSCIESSKFYNITYLNHHIGIFYNNLGKTKISSSTFTLLNHFNLSLADSKFEQLDLYFQRSFSLCSHKGTSSSSNHIIFFCENSIKNLEIDINNLKTKIETVKHLTGHELKPRTRRGILDGGSYVFHWLFGIPDADDAKYYEDSIKQLLDDNRNVQILMKQQIGIISNTISNFNASIQNLKINEQKLNENINAFNNLSLQTVSSINDLKFKSVISEQFSLLNQISVELNNYYDLLISSITLAKHNILHPHVITPLSLYTELIKIILKNDKQFPIPLTYENMHYYFNLIKLNVVYTNKILIFVMKIPLVDEITYNLYQLLPLPTPHNTSNLYSYIEPKHPYLLMSTTKVYYATLTGIENCNYTPVSGYICYQTMVVRTFERPICETILLTSVIKKIPTSCKTHTVMADLEALQPLKPNFWLFSMSHPVQLTLACDETPIQDVKLESTGILKLQKNCKGYTQTYVLEATNEVTLEIMSLTPEYNIANDDCCVKKNEELKITTLTPIKITNIKLDELKYATHKLKQFDEILQTQINKPMEFHHSNWFSSIISSIAIIASIILLICILRCCRISNLLKKLFCSKSDGCCTKIFNTNITTPVTPMQLSRILEEERRRTRDDSNEDDEELFTRRKLLPNVSRRRSLTMAPTIDMN